MNLGQSEQIVRGVVGAGLIVVTGLGAVVGVWKIAAVILGSVGVFTASAGFCPLYRALGLGRRERPHRHA
ncbi:MAG TPA: DUF2892 domain-containing protein [Longimicrobiales bacterium]|nr:DUF2892 domain-containing protein [Longimicrobiales bacterium]